MGRASGILWRGASPVDGAPIMCVVTDKTKNTKMGGLLQTWIMRSDLHPSEVRKRPAMERSICGGCANKVSICGGCYVRNDPLTSIWYKYLRGGYEPLSLDALAGQKIRWGAYGDPAMLPERLVREANEASGVGHVGYTHQSRHPWAQWARGTFMASADTVAQARALKVKGWGTFRVAEKAAIRSEGRPCDSIAGATCAECLKCDGRRLAIWIPAHGMHYSKTVAERISLRQVA